MARIIVIDDDRKLREVICRALERAGYNVIEAADGRAGIRLYREQGGDLVVTDIFMPERDGLETIRLLRRESPELKIVAISGGDGAGRIDLQEEARLFGAARTLGKPFEPGELVKVVRDLLAETTPSTPTQKS